MSSQILTTTTKPATKISSSGSPLPSRRLSNRADLTMTPISTPSSTSLTVNTTVAQNASESSILAASSTYSSLASSSSPSYHSSANDSTATITNTNTSASRRKRPAPIITTPIDPSDPLLLRWPQYVEGPFIRALDESQQLARLGWNAIDFARVGTHEFWWMNPVRVVVYVPGTVHRGGVGGKGKQKHQREQMVPPQQNGGEEEQEDRAFLDGLGVLERELGRMAVEGLQGAWAVWKGVVGEEGDGEGEGVRVEECGLYRVEIMVRGMEDEEVDESVRRSMSFSA